ncbi:MAG: YdcF family protein, partial [Chitinophagaceae bacterium]
DMAVEQYRQGKAPYIMVSGGHVHPSKTRYCEAVEMQKYLVNRHQIPANAIIIEPHARHTTTNLRNAARLVYLFGIPDHQRIMIVTDVFQSTYIPMMSGRFMDELGYLPYRGLERNRDGRITFLPDRAALRINPYDPLDP